MPLALAVSGNGEVVYVATLAGTLEYTLSGESYVQAAILDPNASIGVSIAPSGDVFVDQGTEVVEFEPSSAQLGSIGAGVLSAGYGVGINGETGDVYVIDSGAGVVDVFGLGETPAVPVTGPTGSLTGTTAVLEGTLGSGGGGTTGYYFAYNAGASCEGGANTTPGAATAGVVQTEVSELKPHTTYTFCLVATNKFGLSSGPGVSFETDSVRRR